MKSASVLAVITTATSTTLAGGLPADITFISNRIDFNAGVPALSIEDFESEALGDVALPNTFDSGLGVNLTSGDVSSYVGANNEFGFENTVGARNYLAFGRNNDIPGGPTDVPETGSYTVALTFGGAVNALAFDLSGFQPEDAAGGFNVTILSNGQIVNDFFFPSGQEFGETRFYGFVADNSFDEFRINFPVIGQAGTADYVAFDGIAWGVPTPGATSLLALAAFGATRRRRN